MLARIKYRSNTGIEMVRADRVSGEYFQEQSYWNFYLGGKLVKKVGESRILPESREMVKRLYGSPWKEKIEKLPSINLWEGDYLEHSGLPDDFVTVWNIGCFVKGAYYTGGHEAWLIECEKKCVLQILNNKDVVARGTLTQAVKKLFPGKNVFKTVTERRIVAI